MSVIGYATSHLRKVLKAKHALKLGCHIVDKIDALIQASSIDSGIKTQSAAAAADVHALCDAVDAWWDALPGD